MIVLGLNAYGHDAACALLCDGEVVFASSQERFDRKRHSGAFPEDAIRAALEYAAIREDQVDRIAFPWTQSMGRAAKVRYVLRHMPRSLAFLRERPDASLPDRVTYLRRMRMVGSELRTRGFRAPLVRVPHHLAHAASASLALPNQTGAAITADGMGEWTTAGTWCVRRGRPSRLRSAEYPHSPGKAYAAVTQWLGFRPESDEGKTMGLAPYGRTTGAAWSFARGLIEPDPARMLRVRAPAFGFPFGRARLYGDAFTEALGPPREDAADLLEVHQDAARGIQDAVEEVFLATARQLLEESPAEALAVAGGLFLNCAMNGRLLRDLPVPVLPFPVSGDAGAAWGAAAWVHQTETDQPAAPLRTLRLGHDITASEVQALALPAPEIPADLVGEVAALLAAGKLVGVARGRAEFGPRALGGRSVLASPTSIEIRDRVNAHKGREAWRPLAPMVLDGDDRLFQGLTSSPWMILTFFATPEGKRLVPGAVHVDGTARVQTLGENDDPFIRNLLGRLPSLGHPACVLNTSLNRRGEPIVNTAAEALRACRAMRLDAVVLDDGLVRL